MEENKFIINARSKKNGIVFYSNRIPFLGIEAILDDSENIQTNIVDKGLEKFIDYLGTYNEEENTLNKKRIIIFYVLIIILSIVLYVCFKNFGFLIASMYFLAFVFRDLYEFINEVPLLRKKDKHGYSIAKFHGAEHKVVNAYNKLERIPTLEEAKKFSRFSKLCGSRTIIYSMFTYTVLTVSLFLYFSFNFNDFMYLAIMLAIIISIKIGENYGVLNFFQVFVTSDPGDKEIELAIEGLKQFETLEDKLERGESFSFTMNLPTILFEEEE